MQRVLPRLRRRTLMLAAIATGAAAPASQPVLAQAPAGQAIAEEAVRPMTFLDVQHMRSAGSFNVSPDGRHVLHTVSFPDWKEARSQTDLFIVSTEQGVPSSRQLTFTAEKNESQPAWLPDGSAFVFLSNRDAPSSSANQNQLYLMRTDGGEARRVTDATAGVSNFAFSPDGRWLVYRSGRSNQEQLYRVPVHALTALLNGTAIGTGTTAPEAEQVSRHGTGVGSWEWAPDSRRIYFLTRDTLFEDERLRRENRFTVNVYNEVTPLSSLWALDLDPSRTTRLTDDTAYDVTSFNVSPDGRWIGFNGVSSHRYHRNITEQNINADLYLLEVATGSLERLTENDEVGESGPFFSPDSRTVAFVAPEDLTRYTMGNRRIWLRPVDQRGGEFRMLGGSFDGNLSVGFWSDDGRTIYFNEGIRATRQLMARDVQRNTVRQVTDAQASLSVSRDDASGLYLISYQDPTTPSTLFVTRDLNRIGNRSTWRQLTDVNPQVRNFALGAQEEITWTSTDGKEVGGVLTYPVGYQPGQRYPLIVAIHGGPASADVLGFNGGYGSQVYAGAGYAVLKPNYRGSTNYGEAFRTDIVGNYFPQGYDDIMTGVDHLIAEGLVDGNRMGALGWSAGGHWSNWILVNTDRFKAISSGAGTSNWISMYAQSDVQRNRQFYLGDDLPYHNFDAYWDQSPLKYIANAKTPTMIHVVEGDPRVPSPQSVELHMALRQLGVETELFMYPGNSHGIPDPRNRLVKSMSEMAWMDYYVRGIGEKFQWRQVLETLQDPRPAAASAANQGGR
ncbi:MAG TPA: S9 family peptidase [Longimicrobiales bacterium]|nr:S9 family peptidase [Longimicrobiales bacterium]